MIVFIDSASNDFISPLAWGVVCAAAGVTLLVKLEAAARLDQHCGIKWNSWLKSKLGDSFLTRDLYSVGTPGGLRKSKIGLGVAGVMLLLLGLAVVTFSVWDLLYLRHAPRIR
jgi:hypothetical protein